MQCAAFVKILLFERTLRVIFNARAQMKVMPTVLRVLANKRSLSLLFLCRHEWGYLEMLDEIDKFWFCESIRNQSAIVITLWWNWISCALHPLHEKSASLA